jgi:hypothetical protein
VINKRIFLTLAVAAFLLLQFTDCMSAKAPDLQSMQCCGSMPCTPSNRTQDCCKTMVSAHAPSMLPAARASLGAPATVLIEHIPTIESIVLIKRVAVEIQLHSPPELYTLHASFLI